MTDFRSVMLLKSVTLCDVNLNLQSDRNAWARHRAPQAATDGTQPSGGITHILSKCHVDRDMTDCKLKQVF